MSEANHLTAQRLLELSQSFCLAKTLMSAVELGVFERLAVDGPLNEQNLRMAIGIHPRGARDFFDALVALRLLERGAEGRYYNTSEASSFLNPSQPGCVGGWIEMASSRLYPGWSKLTDALRTGQPQSPDIESATAIGHYEALYADPERRAQFLQAMSGSGLHATQEITSKFHWRHFRTVVDVGCAQGALLMTLAQTHVHLQAIGFDLPEVATAFQQRIEKCGLSERVRFEAGNFHNDPLPAAEVLVMGRILHNWDLTAKRMLLAKAFAALPLGGALIIYERMIDDGRRENVFALMASLSMLVMTPGGFDYTAAECEVWLLAAGFRDVTATRLADTHTMIVARK